MAGINAYARAACLKILAFLWYWPRRSRWAADANAALEGVQTRDLNRQVEACTDFYEFANGTWRADNPIPASLPKWSRRLARTMAIGIGNKACWRQRQVKRTGAKGARNSGGRLLRVVHR